MDRQKENQVMEKASKENKKFSMTINEDYYFVAG